MKFTHHITALAVGAFVASGGLTNAATTILVDFSAGGIDYTTTNLGGNAWNEIAADETTYDLVDTANSTTTAKVTLSDVGLTSKHGIGGGGINGPTGPDPFDDVDGGGQAYVTDDGLFSSSADTITITFSGLVTGTQYDFSLIGGRASSGDDGVIDVTTGTGSGLTGMTLLNVGTLLNFSATAADVSGSGVIAFDFYDSSPSGNTRSATLNALSFTAVPEPSSTALLGLGGLALILRRRK